MATSLHKAQEALKTCNEHQHEELSCFCKTCNKFICTKCAKTTHNGHDWDLVSTVAKKRRKETPVLCRKIRKENMPRCRKKLRTVDDNISVVEKASDDDMKKLEARRTEIINVVNQIIDEQKRKREKCRTKETTIMKEQSGQLRAKIDYLDKMTSKLDKNIAAYTDHDVIEMEQELLITLHEVESCDVVRAATAVTFVPGDIEKEQLHEMIGTLEETAMAVQGSIPRVGEVKAFKDFNGFIRSIAPISSTQAWVGDGEGSVNLLSLRSNETQSKALQQFNDFTVVNNGDFIVTGYDDQVIRLASAAGKESVIVGTKPLNPVFISKTPNDDILVSLRDDGDRYKLKPSSRRLVQRMTNKGKILHTYEFREDGVSRLFTLPYRTAENGNSDICVINSTSEYTGELNVLHRNGRLRATYREHEGSKLNLFDVACDSMHRIIVSECTSKSLHLLGPDCTFLRRLLSDMFNCPWAMTLYQDKLWIGFYDGAVKVFKYKYSI